MTSALAKKIGASVRQIAATYELNAFHLAKIESDVIAAIDAQNSTELLTFAQWAVDQFQGESGAGENHWEQFPQYVAGKKAIEDAGAIT